MTQIFPTTVLLIPAPEHANALLKDGPCDARPPILTWCYNDVTDGPDAWSVPGISMRPFEPTQRALVLVHRGTIVWSGVFRAWSLTEDGAEVLMDALHERTGNLAEIARGWGADGTPLGTVICLDATGAEMTA